MIVLCEGIKLIPPKASDVDDDEILKKKLQVKISSTVCGRRPLYKNVPLKMSKITRSGKVIFVSKISFKYLT